MSRRCVDDSRVFYYKGNRFIRDVKTGYYLSSAPVGVNGKRVRLHVFIWEERNGAIPAGYGIHHRDENKENNILDNFILMQSKAHLIMHDKSRAGVYTEIYRKNLIEKAVPASKAWHGSKEGLAWHSEHGKESWETRKWSWIRCCICGKERLTPFPGRAKFCSRACKAKDLRQRFKAAGRDYEYGRKNKENQSC
jgi:hypothetical protein